MGRFTFLLSDISRACSHQIARHRGASISEQSQRYVDAEKRVGFTMPKNCTPEQEALMSAHYKQCMAYYRALRSSGMKKEDARFVLPMATNTRMIASFDKNELVHFLGVRCAPDAQWEIRQIAQKMAVQAFLATGNESLEVIVDKYNLMNQI